VPISDNPGQIATIDAKVCRACGYWHERSEGRDSCVHCQAPLVEVSTA